MKVLCFFSGLSLVLLALVVAGLAIFAIIDPVNAKMADDNDPFGPPPSRLSSLAILGGSVGVGFAGVYLVSRAFRSHSDVVEDDAPRIR
jgi:hypothetical protein